MALKPNTDQEDHAAIPIAQRVMHEISNSPFDILNVEDIIDCNESSTDYFPFSINCSYSQFAHRVSYDDLPKGQDSKQLPEMVSIIWVLDSGALCSCCAGEYNIKVMK
eukprot:2924961-Ditylum_brightwellii.AAC.1